MFEKLFGIFGKKNDGFYMQADESTAPDPVENVVVSPNAKAPAPEKKVEKVAVAAVTPTETKASLSNEKAEPVAEESPKATKTSIKDKKKDKKKTKGESKAATPAIETELVATVATVEPTITNFATDYLIKPSSISSRRRPGANMKQFMDMARQVETKKSPGQRAKVK
jgi:hypothetical protein